MKRISAILGIVGLLTTLGCATVQGQPIIPRGIDTGDGPFGINMGEDPIKHGCTVNDIIDFSYLCEEVPKPHPRISGYSVWSYPETGIAFIRAHGGIMENDKYGNSIRAEMDRIAEQIATKYGDWTHYDFILPSGIWTETDEWTASIRQGERTYAYLWEFENHKQLSDITLSAEALSHDDTFFRLEFTFTNKAQFDEIRQNRESDAF